MSLQHESRRAAWRAGGTTAQPRGGDVEEEEGCGVGGQEERGRADAPPATWRDFFGLPPAAAAVDMPVVRTGVEWSGMGSNALRPTLIDLSMAKADGGVRVGWGKGVPAGEGRYWW